MVNRVNRVNKNPATVSTVGSWWCQKKSSHIGHPMTTRRTENLRQPSGEPLLWGPAVSRLLWPPSGTWQRFKLTYFRMGWPIFATATPQILSSDFSYLQCKRYPTWRMHRDLHWQPFVHSVVTARCARGALRVSVEKPIIQIMDQRHDLLKVIILTEKKTFFTPYLLVN